MVCGATSEYGVAVVIVVSEDANSGYTASEGLIGKVDYLSRRRDAPKPNHVSQLDSVLSGIGCFNSK